VLKLKEDECLKTIILLWKWWSNRNKLNKGEKGFSSDEITGDVFRLLNELGCSEKQIHGRTAVAEPKWKAPPTGLLKINTDGSFISDNLSGGWGFYHPRS
jgi:hypothetical protein